MKQALQLIMAFYCLVAFADSANGAVTTHIAESERFEFYSDPWLNAHHFLYQWARNEEGLGEGRSFVDVVERSTLEALDDADRIIWQQALAFYRTYVAHLDHFSDGMLAQKIELLRLDGNLEANPAEKISGLASALAQAMPVYSRYWWREHDNANRRWVQDVLGPLKETENEFVELTVRLYGAQWPDEKRRIDISAYANFRAGYTALGHTVIYSTDPGNQDLYGLEMLLHEVQHNREVAGVARRDLRAAFDTEDMNVPRNLWHSIVFSTAGEFVRRYAAANDTGHQPYWQREGFGELAGWTDAVDAVDRYWLPVVRGESTRGEAFGAIRDHYRRLQASKK